MDTFLSWLPDINYWAVICALLIALNIWQYAKYHGVTAKLEHLMTFGHAPADKAIVPAASVTAQIGPGDAQHSLGPPTQPAIQPAGKRLPWEK